MRISRSVAFILYGIQLSREFVSVCERAREDGPGSPIVITPPMYKTTACWTLKVKNGKTGKIDSLLASYMDNALNESFPLTMTWSHK